MAGEALADAAAELDAVDNLYEANESLRVENARLQARIESLEGIGRQLFSAHDEVQRLQAQLAAQAEVIEAAKAYRHAVVDDVMRHQAGCEDSPCDECNRTVQAEDDALTALFAALTALDASPQAARQQAAERAVRAGIVLPRGPES